jgi:tetratricopeptide (TPR) repeat protein
VRSTLYDEISTTRRLRLHRKVGQTVEARTGGVRVEELAHHYCECAALGEVPKAVEYGRAAARRALDRLAYEEAAGWYERALTVLDPESAADRETRAELLLGLGEARWAAGDRQIAKGVFCDAGALAKSAGRAELLANIAIAHGGKRGWGEAGIVEEQLVSLLEDALAALPPEDSRHRAMAQARLAAELYFEPGNDERRKTLTEQAVAMARRIDDPDALAYTLTCAHWGFWLPGNVDERAPMAAEIVRLAQASGNRELESAGWSWAATDAFEQGDVEGGRHATNEARRLAEELRQPESLWASGVLLGCIALLEGRLDDAERLSEEALQIGQRTGTSTALQMYGVQMFALRRMRGGLEELEPVFMAMVDEYPRIPAWRCGLAYLYSELGWLDAAREQFEILAASDFDLPFDANWSVGMAILAFAASQLGDEERAAVLYDRFLPFAEMTVFAGMPAEVIGPAHMPLGLLAATLGRWDDAERHGRLGMERNAAMGARPWLARSQYEFADLLKRHGDPGDSEEARQLLESCIATCRELGIPVLLERAEGLLGSL